MGDINKKLASLTAEQSRALAAALNKSYNEKGGAKASSKTVKKPPSKKK